MTFPRHRLRSEYSDSVQERKVIIWQVFPDLPTRIGSALWRNGMDSADELACTPDDLILEARNIGPTQLAAIRRVYPFVGARHPSLGIADTVIADLREVGAA